MSDFLTVLVAVAPLLVAIGAIFLASLLLCFLYREGA